MNNLRHLRCEFIDFFYKRPQADDKKIISSLFAQPLIVQCWLSITFICSVIKALSASAKLITFLTVVSPPLPNPIQTSSVQEMIFHLHSYSRFLSINSEMFKYWSQSWSGNNALVFGWTLMHPLINTVAGHFTQSRRGPLEHDRNIINCSTPLMAGCVWVINNDRERNLTWN